MFIALMLANMDLVVSRLQKRLGGGKYLKNPLLGSYKLLEFLGSIVCIWLDILDRDTPPESYLLAMGDSATAIGWLKKSNFTEVDEDDTYTTSKFLASRWLARLVKSSGSYLYSQWFPGWDNDMADYLSRDFHLYIPLLTNLISHANSRLPPNVKNFPLPSEIDSWLYSVLGKIPVKTAQQVRPKMSKLAVGIGEKYSSRTSESKTTPTSNPSASVAVALSSSSPLSKPCEKLLFLTRMLSLWLKE